MAPAGPYTGPHAGQYTGPLIAPPGAPSGAWPAQRAQPSLSGPPPAAGSWWSDALADPWRDPDAPVVVVRTPPAEPPALERPVPAGQGPRASIGLVLVVSIVTALLAGALGGTLGYVFATGGGANGSGARLGADAPLAQRPPDSIAGIAKKVLPSVVTISVQSGAGAVLGSGFVVSPDGYVITNNHVVGGSNGDAVVRFTDGQVAPGKVVGSDPEADVSVLKIDKAGLPADELVPVQIGNSDQVQVGDPVVAVGSPLGMTSTVTSGIVSYIDRPIHTTEDGVARYYAAIQTDAAVNQGNSGGPLFNAAAQVVGINSVIGTLAQDQQAAGNVGLAFSIPINQAKRLAQEIIDTGKARRTVMGATFDAGFRSAQGGAKVESVTSGGPAANGGLKPGDVILAINKRPVEEADDATALVRKYAPGESIQVDYVRENSRQTATVTLVADVN
jgi:putative serine protease PepD